MEVAGLVLAVVPLVSAAAKHWENVYRAGRTVMSQRTRDDLAVDDYRLIHWELVLLDTRLRDFVAMLPNLSVHEKSRLLEAELQLQTSAWTDPRVESALDRQLGTVDRRKAVVNCLKAICEVLEDIVSEKTFSLMKSDLVVSVVGRSRE